MSINHLGVQMIDNVPETNIKDMVKNALIEDIQTGDITSLLISESQVVTAKVITREDMVVCGKEWVSETFIQVDNSLTLKWLCEEGDQLMAGQAIFTISGCTRSILTAERTALNFLQMLSATATMTQIYIDKILHTNAKLLDTRKTIPGFRLAQKYAVRCGGGENHRIGLFDAFLIKENHIEATGGIQNAIMEARLIAPDKMIEVEVESFDELKKALNAKADVIMLDNFPLDSMKQAVDIVDGKAKIEASGNVSLDTIANIAETGVDYISVGALTKNVSAIDLSMRIMDS